MLPAGHASMLDAGSNLLLPKDQKADTRREEVSIHVGTPSCFIF